MKFIILIALCFVLVCEIKSLDTETFVCEPGIHYKENNCNTCRCSNPKIGLSCTRMMCPSSNDKTLTDCKIGTTWVKGCNQCWCVKNFGTVCTTYSC